MLINSSAGRRCTGETRHRSSYSRRAESDCESSRDVSIPSEDWESLACSMKESLSSSMPRSGEVDVEDVFESLLETRCSRPRERDMVVVYSLVLLSPLRWSAERCGLGCRP